jgi:putative spermidine/putrescine transport system permease protein
MSPLLLPALAFGFGALIYFNSIGLAQSMIGLIFGHTVVCVPFVLRNSIAALSQLNPAMQEASESLGAGRLYTFRRVTLPLIAPGVGAGSFIAFMSSFDNVPVSLFLSDARTQMLPIHLWEIIETNLDVRTAAASGVIVVATLVLMILAERFAGLTKQLR